MTDYTPTTEEVRDVYQSRLVKVDENRFELIDQVQADAEFDRWIVAERNRSADRATELERKRLMLEVHMKTGHNGATHYEGMNCGICRVIDIMGGENLD